MKTPSKHLFTLIKSLNTQEKVNFKMFSKRKKDNNYYIQLFDAIDAQTEYNEMAIKEKFRNKPFVRNMDRSKTYIIEAILKSLQLYYAQDSVEAMLSNYIQQIKILVDKRLFELANKLIVKAENLASNNHQYAYLQLLYPLKNESYGRTIHISHLNKFDSELHKQELKNIEYHKNTIEYQHLYGSILGIIQHQYTNLDEDAILKLQQIKQGALLKNKQNAFTPLAKIYYYRTLGEIDLFLKNYQLSSNNFKEVIKHFSEIEMEVAVKMHIYAKVIILAIRLNNYLDVKVAKNMADELMESIPKKLLTPRLYREYLAVINNCIDYEIITARYDDANKQAIAIEELAVKYLIKDSLLVYYCNLALTFFCMTNTNYKNALKYVNKALSIKGVEAFDKEIVVAVNTFLLIIHFELENDNVLISRSKSLQLYLQRTAVNCELEKTIVSFFIDSANQHNNCKEGIDFLLFNKKLNSVKNKGQLIYFDYFSWIESKIQNRSMLEILKEKANSK